MLVKFLRIILKVEGFRKSASNVETARQTDLLSLSSAPRLNSIFRLGPLGMLSNRANGRSMFGTTLFACVKEAAVAKGGES